MASDERTTVWRRLARFDRTDGASILIVTAVWLLSDGWSWKSIAAAVLLVLAMRWRAEGVADAGR